MAVQENPRRGQATLLEPSLWGSVGSTGCACEIILFALTVCFVGGDYSRP